MRNWTWIESQTSCPLERQTSNKKKLPLTRLPRRWNPSKEYRELHRGRLKVHSRNLLFKSKFLEWTCSLKVFYYLPDYCGKSAVFLNTFNTLKYTHIHRKDSRIQLYYQRLAEVFWCWVLWWLENSCDSCWTLDIRAIPIPSGLLILYTVLVDYWWSIIIAIVEPIDKLEAYHCKHTSRS